MKKIIFLILIVLSSSYAGEERFLDWTRVREKFTDPEIKNYISKMREGHPDWYSDTSSFSTQSGETLIYTCWQDLFTAKKKFPKKSQDYCYTYEIMAKLFLARGIFPKGYYNEEKFPSEELTHRAIRKFIKPIIKKLSNVPAEHKGRVASWAGRYRGMLFMYLARKSETGEQKNEHLKAAYTIFTDLSEASTTRTNQLLLAEILIDDKYIPEGYTAEIAKQYGLKLVNEALTFQGSAPPSSKKEKVYSSSRSALEKMAHPIYLRAYRKYSESLRKEEALLPAARFLLRLSEKRVLPSNREKFISGGVEVATLCSLKISGMEEQYFKRINVSGRDMDCFFNATGLKRDEEANKLLDNLGDENVRAMIANEIVNLTFEALLNARGSEHLSASLKSSISYDHFQKKIKAINDRRELRNKTSDPSGSLTLESIDQDQEKIRHDLYRHASQREACKVYIKEYIQPNGRMMNNEPSLEGAQHSHTVIDAIAYLNKAGLVIYKSAEKKYQRLVLHHRFIPESAEKIFHVYHSGIHYQFLFPFEIEKSPPSAKESSSATQKWLGFDIPSDTELTKMFPQVNRNNRAQKKIASDILNDKKAKRCFYLAINKLATRREIVKRLSEDGIKISEFVLSRLFGANKINPSRTFSLKTRL